MVFWIIYVFVVCSGCTGYHISGCGSDGKVDLDETRPTILTCTGITDGTVKWEVELGYSNITVAACTLSTSPCHGHFAGFTSEISERNTSTLTVTLNDRTGITGVIRCGGSAMGSNSATCNIRIVHKADKVTGCSVTVNNKDWTVTAWCNVDKMFASDDEYSCYWIVPTHNGNETIGGALSRISFTENNKTYTRGTCVISGLAMPTADGVYIYSVIIDPGVGLLAGPSLEIKQPENPKLLNCPDVVTEGDDVDCFCQPSSSSPLAVTSWYPGFSNFIQMLPLTNVNSSMDGTNYTCTQHWGGVSNNFRKSIIYTLRVASWTKITTQTARTTVPASIITTLTTNSVTNDGPAVSGDDVTDSDSLPAIAGGVGGGIVVIIIIVSIIIVFVVVSKRRRATTKTTSSTLSAHEETHTYVNQAAVLNNERSDDNEGDDFGNYIDIINNVHEGEGGATQPALGGESNYDLPTRRSQVVDTNIYTGLDAQQQASTSQDKATYELPTRRSQVVDTNIYTGLDPQSQGNDCQETEITQYQNTATQRPTAQKDTRRAINKANRRDSTDQTDYEIL